MNNKFSNNQFKKDIKKIKKFLKKVEGSEGVVEMLESCRDTVLENRKTLLQLLEQKNKTRTENDFLEIIEAEGGTHRYTINPCTGRHTLKIAKKATRVVQDELISLVSGQLNRKDLPLVTLRGKITWEHWKESYDCVLYSESKKFKLRII